MFKIKNILQYPWKKSALLYLLKNPSLAYALLSYPAPSKYYLSRSFESICDSDIVASLRTFFPDKFLDAMKEKDSFLIDDYRLLLYMFIRKYKPEVVVETGVAHGASTAVMLCAMHENNKGHLYSIDLPVSECIVSTEEKGDLLADGQRYNSQDKFEPGHIVPEYLKDRWTLTLGDAKEELPALLKDIKEISIFFHDSLHTYQHMKFEFELAWPYISDGGFLLSHDIMWNKAFLEFSRKINLKPLMIYKTLGAIRKVSQI